MSSARELRERADAAIAAAEQEIEAQRCSELPAHWREAAREYHADRARHGGDVRATRRERPVYRGADRPIADGGRVPSAAELDAEYYAAIRRDGAAQSTVDAVVYELRERGLAALAAPNCRGRLVDLSCEQIEAVIVRLLRLRSRHPAISDELILALDKLRS